MGLYHFPRDLEQIISRRAAAEDATPRELAEAIRRLSDLFVGKAVWDPGYNRDPKLRAAYLAYFLPVNLPKVHVPLGEWLTRRRDRFAGRHLRCLDLGSGPGTALLGLCDFIRNLSPEERPAALDLVGADLSGENLHDAAALLEALAAADPRLPPLRFEPIRLDLFADRSGLFPLARTGGRFDLVIAANVICEGDGPDAGEPMLRQAAAEVLAPDGAIIVIEPGLRETSRDLHRLRDRLLASGDLHVLAPCLHEAPCPALATVRDWCYADLAWDPPPLVAELDRLTGLRKGSLKFSYLLLSPETPEAPAAGAWRVVSDVLEEKGERRVYLCADGRWIVLGQLKRHGGPNEEVFRSLRRGDLVEVAGIETRATIFRLPPTGTIRRLPAGVEQTDETAG